MQLNPNISKLPLFSSNQNNNLAFKPNSDKDKLASTAIFQKNCD
jgi:hypothetical protein